MELPDDPTAGTFRLDAVSQTSLKLSTTTSLDREFKSIYSVQILCKDGGVPSLNTTHSTTVHVLDMNDHTPVLAQYNFTVHIQENNAVGQQLAKLDATDGDIGRNSEVVFQISSGPRNYINVDPYSGNVTARMALDYEQVKDLYYSILAFDQGVPSRTVTAYVTVHVTDVNDEKPVFSQPHYVMQVPENGGRGAEVGAVSATDSDSPPNNEFIFEFLPSSDDTTYTSAFVIEPYSGRIFTKSSLDREEVSQVKLRVRAFDKHLPSLSSVTEVTIDVTDVNDHYPIIRFPSSANQTLELEAVTSESQEDDVIVAVIDAFDADNGENALLSFYIVAGDETGAFIMDPESGELRVQDWNKVRAQAEFSLRILVTDNGEEPLSNHTTLRIRVVTSSPALLNQLILIIVGSVSALVILVLVTAIVVLKCREKRRKQTKAEAARPSHQYYMQPKPYSSSQESLAEPSTPVTSGFGETKLNNLSAIPDTAVSLAEVNFYEARNGFGEPQIRYHVNPASGQHAQVCAPPSNILSVLTPFYAIFT